MSRKIQVLRGEEASMPALDVGEFAWTTDTQKLYIGNGEEAIDLTTVDIDADALVQHPELRSLIRSVGVRVEADVATTGALPSSDEDGAVRYVESENQSYIRREGVWTPFAKVVGAEHLERLTKAKPANPNLLRFTDFSDSDNLEHWAGSSGSTVTDMPGTEFFKVTAPSGNNVGLRTEQTFDPTPGENLIVSFYAALSNVDTSWSYTYWLDPSALLNVEDVKRESTGERIEGLPIEKFTLRLAPSTTADDERRFLIGSRKQTYSQPATFYISEPKLEHGIEATPYITHDGDDRAKIGRLETAAADNPNLFTERFNVGWSSTVSHRGIVDNPNYRYTLIELEPGTYHVSATNDMPRNAVRIQDRDNFERVDGISKGVYWDDLPMTFSVTETSQFIFNFRQYGEEGTIQPYPVEFSTAYELGFKLEHGTKRTRLTHSDKAVNDVIRREESAIGYVNVVDFGADPRGNAVSTDAFQEAIAYLEGLGGGQLHIPAGEYRVTAVLNVPSNVVIYGAGTSNTVIKTARANLFSMSGTIEEEVAVTSHIQPNSTTIQVADAAPFSTGDDILIMGQRNCLTDDAGDFRLGRWTGSNYRELYFGEFRRIVGKEGARTVEIDTGLNFPGYRSDASQETVNNPRKSSGVFKVNFNENVTIRDLTVDGDSFNVIRTLWAKNCQVENVNWRNGLDGNFILWDRSLMCEARNCHAEPRIPTGSEVGGINSYKTASSFSCGFDGCSAQGGRAASDFTYIIGWMNGSYSYFKNGRIMNARRGLVAHGGTYGTVYEGNEMYGIYASGIGTRSKASRVSNNTVIGSTGASWSYGIAIYECGASDSIVTDNVVSNFFNAIYFVDTALAPFKYLGTIVANNHLTRMYNGIRLSRADGNPQPRDVRANILIDGNYMRDFKQEIGTYGKGVNSDRYFHAVDIRNNTVVSNAGSNAGIYAVGDCDDWSFSGNRLYGYVASGIWMGGITDDATFGANYEARVWVDSSNTQSQNRLNGRINVMPMYTTGNVTPTEDNAFSVGTGSRRYTRVYATNGVSTSSDATLKEDINELNLGLELLRKLKPKSYRFKGEEKTHYGVMAQDLEALFKEHGIDTSTLAMIERGEGEDAHYSMNYSELIPLLINAVQELYNERND